MNAMRIWQTTNTQNTEGTAQREGTQMSCRDDHELMKEPFRIICTNHIETMQRTQIETLVMVRRNRNSINGICKETGQEDSLYKAKYTATTEYQFTGREQGLYQGVPQ